MRRIIFQCGWLTLCGWLWLHEGAVRAEQLPLKAYTTADGLAHNHINRIRTDSRGYLWFCTDEGLSRFDGYQFISFTTAQGMPHRTVNDLLEARDGTYWLATDGGVCRFDPFGASGDAAQPLFIVHRLSARADSNHVNTLAEDADGSLWCATSDGLFRLQRLGGRVQIAEVDIGLPHATSNDPHVSAVLLDQQGVLWVGAISGLYRRWPDGHSERFTTQHGLPDDFVQTLFADRDGRVWGGTRKGGLCLFAPTPPGGIVERVFAHNEGLAGNDVRQIFRASDGHLWVATTGGLSEFVPEAAGQPQWLNFTTAHGLSSNEVYKLGEDGAGNLWLGTRNSGVLRLAHAGFTTYGAADGYRGGPFITLAENPARALRIYSGSPQRRWLQRLTGQRFAATLPRLPPRVTDVGVGTTQFVMQDSRNDWWLPVGGGELLRFAHVDQPEDLARAASQVMYDTRRGLPHSVIHQVYEDRRGDVWLAFDCELTAKLWRWERATGTWQDHSAAAGLARADGKHASALRADAVGSLWIGFTSGRGLARYAAGRFTWFTTDDGVPAGTITTLHLDQAQRLWLATSEGGLGCLADPAAERPRFTRYTVAQGLASNEIWSLTEDHWGRIYAGLSRGLDRLDPATGHVRHFTTADGLAPGEVRGAYRDRDDVLWFVTEQGVSRLSPVPEASAAPPPIVISGVRVLGVPQPVSALGATQLAGLAFAAPQNQLQIDFLGLDFSAGASLRYQYQLNAQTWSVPAPERTVNYPNLPPGDYRFAVRAVNAEGVVSEPAAQLSFTIARPVWRRGWFLLLMAAALSALVYGGYRYRLAQFLALERVRTRIAADLHDDIGANLTKIAILSEVSKQRLDTASLDEIADSARASVAAMSDIVWAINPRKDSLRDLVRRTREFAEATFEARDIAFDFAAPDLAADVKLGADVRRQVYLIFKESLNNLVRHAHAPHADIALQVEGRWLTLRVSDDGVGFDLAHEHEGNGLLSMQKRAEALGGTLNIVTRRGEGTTVWLRLPLAQGTWLRLRK